MISKAVFLMFLSVSSATYSLRRFLNLEDRQSAIATWGPWGSWGNCDSICGRGVQTRYRTCINTSSATPTCPGATSESLACDSNPCPIDGQWGEWSVKRPCSAACGGGTMVRERDCNNPAPANGGLFCPGAELEESICSLQPCTPPFSRLLVGLGAGNEVSFEVIDLLNKSKICTPPPNFPRVGQRAIACLQPLSKKAFVCGGRVSNTSYNNDCYTLVSSSWAPSNNLTEPRYFAASAAFPKMEAGTLPPYYSIVTGGADSPLHSLSSLEILKMVNSTPAWLEVNPPIPVPIHAHCIVPIGTSRVMVIGGIQNGTNYQRKTYILDINKCSWTEGPQLLTGRSEHRCARIQVDTNANMMGTIVIGGITANSPDGTDTTEFLQDDKNAWELGPKLPYPLTAAQVVDHPNGGALMVGGSSTGSTSAGTATLLLKNFKSAWSADILLKTARSGHVALLIPNSEAICY